MFRTIYNIKKKSLLISLLCLFIFAGCDTLNKSNYNEKSTNQSDTTLKSLVTNRTYSLSDLGVLNEPPLIKSSFQSALTVNPQEQLIFIVRAVDPEGTELSFKWNSDKGSIVDITESITSEYIESYITWKAPPCGTEPIIVSMSVSDIDGKIAVKNFLPVTLNNASPCDEKIIYANGITEDKLSASDKQSGDQLGYSVSISGDYAIVGARYEDGGSGSGEKNSGAAYIYEKGTDGIWQETQILHASNMYEGDNFGSSVDISGSYAIIGAKYEDGGMGHPFTNAGEAYIFERNESGVWIQVAELRASDIQNNDYFGASVAISGNFAIVGAYREDGGSGNPQEDSGAVYVFERDSNGNWNEVQILHASNMYTEDKFGYSVDIDGSYVIVGAKCEDGGMGHPFKEAGGAYIFERNSSGLWVEIAKLRASDIQEYDYFGTSVSISGNYAVVGATHEDGGIGDGVIGAGAVYVFHRDNTGAWIEQSILRASDMEYKDRFGISLSIKGSYVMVGSYMEDGGKRNPVVDSGAVYLFKKDSSGNWKEIAKVHSNDRQPGDNFGWSVSFDGTYGIIGAPFEDGGNDNPLSGAGAAYIMKLDFNRINTEDKLSASDKQSGDQLGYSVSISGDYAIVGARYEDGGSGNTEKNSGAAYIYKKGTDGIWQETQILHASNMYEGDNFGSSVDISGSYAIIGAKYEDGGMGHPFTDAGEAYIFERNESGVWIQVAELRASDIQNNDYFGASVAISGNFAIVGAYREDGGSGNPQEDSGAVYVFERDSNGNWNEVQILHASNMYTEDKFGYSVDIDGSYVIVGAKCEDGGMGHPFKEAGGAYIFERNSSGLWVEIAKLRASDIQEYDYFGTSVSISGNYAVVGATHEDGGIGDGVIGAGAVYVFHRDNTGAWIEQSILRASDMEYKDRFGISVSIKGSYVMVGSYMEDGGRRDPVVDSGAVYLFKKDSLGNWKEIAKVHSNDRQSGDSFGWSVSFDGTYGIIGAPFEDGGNDNPLSGAGAAYIIKLD